MQHVGQFAAFHLPTCRKMGHAARPDMFRGKKEKRGKQLHPTYRQESGESSSICLLTRKREQVRLHRFVDEKGGKAGMLTELDGKKGTTLSS
jgi:hypothetical protein